MKKDETTGASGSDTSSAGPEPMAIKASIFLKRVGAENFLDLAIKDSFEVIIVDAALLVKNLTGTLAVIPGSYPGSEDLGLKLKGGGGAK